jgi:hypothetical protein
MDDNSTRQTGSWTLGTSRSKIETWTILCAEFTQPERRSHCHQVADTLRRVNGIRPADVRCEHDDVSNASRLHYGEYERKLDTRTERRSTSPQLEQDFALIRDLGDDRGRPVFGSARMSPIIDVAAGHSEWSLESSSGGVYTLQVAVFYPERGFNEPRKAAVELVRQLRAEGHQAFHHHDGSRSTVTVGLFGEDAVIHDTQTGKNTLSSEVQRFRSREEFKYNYENGQKRTKIVDGKRFVPYSFLVRVPGQPAARR